MIVIWGTRNAGKVDQREGQYALTRFAHVYWLPLFPVSSLWVTRDGYGYDPQRGELWFAGETAETVLLELDARRSALADEARSLSDQAQMAERAARVAEEKAAEAEAAFARVAPRMRMRRAGVPTRRSWHRSYPRSSRSYRLHAAPVRRPSCSGAPTADGGQAWRSRSPDGVPRLGCSNRGAARSG